MTPHDPNRMPRDVAAMDLRDHLAVDRTALANERTLLAYWRTAIGALIAGLMLLKLDWGPDGTVMHLLGATFVAVAVLTAVVGFWRYRTMRGRLSRRRPPEALSADHEGVLLAPSRK